MPKAGPIAIDRDRPRIKGLRLGGLFGRSVGGFLSSLQLLGTHFGTLGGPFAAS